MIALVVATHNSVGEYSSLFERKLRRFNYVTPKNYLDYIFTYTKLLEEKDKFILGLVRRKGGKGRAGGEGRKEERGGGREGRKGREGRG